MGRTLTTEKGEGRPSVANLVFKHVLGVIRCNRSSHNVIHNNIDHEIPLHRSAAWVYIVSEVRDAHFPAVNLRRKSFEVVGGTETRVQLSRVLDPVP